MPNSKNNPLESEYYNYRDLAIFKQSEVVLGILEIVLEVITMGPTDFETEYDRAMYDHHKQSLMENALLIPTMIAEAHGNVLYSHKMECATIIRKAAKELITHAKGLEQSGFKEVDYLNLIGEAIEDLRVLFANWVSTFDPKCYVVDRWGLFNPSGIKYDEKNAAKNSNPNLNTSFKQEKGNKDNGGDHEDDGSFS